ncbi:MAG: hypothetical protein ACFBSE_15520 [Prochloraceae cyanobacterium]
MLYKTHEEQLEIARDITTPANKLIKLGKVAVELQNEEVLNQIAKNPNSPPDLLIELAIGYLGCCIDDLYLEAIANNPAIDLILLENPNFLENLYDRLEKYGLEIFIKKLPDKFLKIASTSCYSSLRYFTASNENSPREILEKLANDPEIHIKEAVARNKNTPIYILEKLANEAEEWIKESLAENKNTPVDILNRLAEDPSDLVRKQVATNKNTPASILKKLAKDSSISVRLAVANNSNINPSLIKLLFEDKNHCFDLNDYERTIEAIELEIKRLNWTEERARKYLKKKYYRKFLSFLSHEQIIEFWQYLRSIESESYPTSLREDIFNQQDDIPF